ncbi:MAG: alpha/beta hydrolase family esterase [Candidatus Methanofastidiosia archaeon]
MMNKKNTLIGILLIVMAGVVLIKLSKQPTAKQPVSPGDYAFSIEHDDLTRTYKVHVPPSYDKNVKTPVVIYTHGGGGNSETAYIDGMDKASDELGFILVAPESMKIRIDGRFSTRWNGGKWQGGECCGTADDVGFISKMIDEIEKKFNVDEDRVYATGISNGGLMTNRLACELSDKIAAVATVAPAAIPQNCTPSRPISVMDIHGTADPCNPFDGGEPTLGFCARLPYKRMSPKEVVDSWLKINSCSADFITVYKKRNATCISYRQCKNGAEVEFCKIEGMGHTWPSGSQYLPAYLVGPVSYDISFEQMWEFFKKHPLTYLRKRR